MSPTNFWASSYLLKVINFFNLYIQKVGQGHGVQFSQIQYKTKQNKYKTKLKKIQNTKQKYKKSKIKNTKIQKQKQKNTKKIQKINTKNTKYKTKQLTIIRHRYDTLIHLFLISMYVKLSDNSGNKYDNVYLDLFCLIYYVRRD